MTDLRLHCTVLIVEDAAVAQAFYRRALEPDSCYYYRFWEVESVQAALELSQHLYPDLILLDYMLPDGTGLEFLEQWRQQWGGLDVPIIMLTEKEDDQIAVQAFQQGVQDYWLKSQLTEEGLRRTVHNTLDRFHLQQQVSHQQAQLNLINRTALRIHGSLEIQEILQITVAEVRHLLQADRTLIYQFAPDFSGTVVAESAVPPWDGCLHCQGQPMPAIAHLSEPSLNLCPPAKLPRCEAIQSSLSIPILLPESTVPQLEAISLEQHNRLWGLLIVHQCSHSRQWQTFESDLLQHLARQLAIAIQQAAVYDRIQTELSERRRIEDRLEDQERSYRQLFDHNPLPLWVFDLQTLRFIAVNEVAVREYGYSRAEFFAMTIWDLHPAEDIAPLRAAMQGSSEKSNCKYIWHHRKKNGTLVDVEITSHPLIFQGKQARIILANDITERNQIEEALRRSEATQRAIVSNIPDLLIRANRQGEHLEMVSGGSVNVVHPPIYVSQPSVFHVLPDNLARLRLEATQAALDTQSLQTYEQQLTIGNQVYWEEVRITPLREDEVLVIVRDITERVQQAQELHMIRHMVENAQEGINLIDANGQICYVNDTLCRELGYSREELLQMFIWDIDPLNPKETFQAGFARLAQKGHDQFESQHRTKSGEIHITEVAVNLLEFNQQVYGCAFVRNIDEKAHLEAERQQAEQALRNSESKHRALVEALPDLVMRMSGEGTYLDFFTTKSFQVFGSQDLVGKNIYDEGLPWDLAALRMEYIQEALHSGELQVYEQKLVVAGKQRTEEVRVSKCADNEVVILVRDISERAEFEAERKRTMKALKHSEETKQAIIQSLPDLLIRMDRSGCYREVLSSGTVRMLPLPKGIAQPSVYAILPIDLAAQQIAYAERALIEGKVQVYEQQMEFPGHEFRQEEVRITALNEEEVLIIVRDISDRKQAEAALYQLNQDLEFKVLQRTTALRESQTRYQNIAATVPGMLYECVIYPDGSNAFLYVSPRCQDLLEISPELLLSDSQYMWNQVHPEDLGALQANSTTASEQGTPFKAEFRFITSSGKLKWLQANALPSSRKHQGAGIWSGIVVDISEQQAALQERKQAQLQLQDTNQKLAITNAELARATRLKDEFLANMSHELRTPLNAILGMSESLLDEIYGELNDQQKRQVSTIERSGQHLLDLINDILDLSKIEAGKLLLQTNAVSIQDLCRISLSFIQQTATQKNIYLSVEIAAEIQDTILDELRIRQLLINLLTNAVKFTPNSGSVRLSVYLEPQENPERSAVTVRNVDSDASSETRPARPTSQWLTFAVTDTGIGIAPENLHQLFQAFVQIDSKLNRQYSGTGLGLVLVKRIAELHGGTVSVESKVGQGSCFRVRIPYRVPLTPKTRAGQATLERLNQKRSAEKTMTQPPLILLAEDNPANVCTMSEYFTHSGYRMMVANNGEEAIAMAKKFLPDLILMDVQMPGVDGLEATRTIRTEPTLIRVPIVALTALAMPTDRDKCLEAGVNEYVTKPVRLKQLALLIEKLLGDRVQ